MQIITLFEVTQVTMNIRILMHKFTQTQKHRRLWIYHNPAQHKEVIIRRMKD